MQNLVVFSGAGMSAESGLSTFRDQNGLWDQYPIEEVATPNAWNKDPEKVLHFYKMRMENCLNAKPNMAHEKIFQLEKKYKVQIVTQNIDNLHERAGSSHVLHLHGEIMKSRSIGTGKTYPIKSNIYPKLGDLCPNGHQLRPDVVWFGEDVPNLYLGAEIIEKADILIIIGTSLQVYPAAGLVNYASENCKIYIIDPNEVPKSNKWNHLKMNASEGLEIISQKLMLND